MRLSFRLERCVAIAQAHRNQGRKSPMKADLVTATMKGIRHQHGTRQRTMKPISRDRLLEMLAVFDQQKSHRTKAARDRALRLIGYAGAFRRAERVTLRVQHGRGQARNERRFLGGRGGQVAARKADVDQGHQRILSWGSKTKDSQRCLVGKPAGVPTASNRCQRLMVKRRKLSI